MEKDNELKGIGNSLDFGARIYDSRVGRFLSIDPLAAKFPWESNFIFGGNNPIFYIDKNGEYKMKPEEARKSKEFFDFINNQLAIDIQNSERLQKGLKKYGQFKDLTEILKTVEKGSGPFIFFRTNEEMLGADGEYSYMGGKDGLISINENLLNNFKNCNDPFEREAHFLVLISTLLHETVHHGDAISDGTQNDDAENLLEYSVVKEGQIVKVRKFFNGNSSSDIGTAFESEVYFGTENGGDHIEDVNSANQAIKHSKSENGDQTVIPTTPKL